MPEQVRGSVSVKGNDDLPTSLRLLTEDLEGEIDELMVELQAGNITVEEWREELEELLRRYWAAAVMAGQMGEELDADEMAFIEEGIERQMEFLDVFAGEIEVALAAGEWDNRWAARARLYGRSIGDPWWAGRTLALPLPAMPRDGTTQCLNNCQCRWEVVVVASGQRYDLWRDADFVQLQGVPPGDLLNVDAYWTLGPVEHCQTCVARARLWSPLRIRDGVLLNTPAVISAQGRLREGEFAVRLKEAFMTSLKHQGAGGKILEVRPMPDVGPGGEAEE